MSSPIKTQAWGSEPEMFGPRHEHRLGLIMREVRRIRQKGRVLDGAVGMGQLARRMEATGRRVFGIDSSFDAALYVRRNSTVPAVVGDMTHLPFRALAFDAVTTGETLEHLDDDAAAAREIARVLRGDGLCIATVPALQMLWSEMDEFYDHRRRYGRAALESLFETAGFSRVRAAFYGFPIVLAYDLLFLLPFQMRRARGATVNDRGLQSVARAGRSRLLVNLVRAAFAVDHLFRWIPFGPGLVLVARKQSIQLAARGEPHVQF